MKSSKNISEYAPRCLFLKKITEFRTNKGIFIINDELIKEENTYLEVLLMLYTKGKIHIRPLEVKDTLTLAKWLSNPVVLEFYEGRDQVFTPEMIEDKFFNRKNGEIGCIVEFNNLEIGYLQYYPLDEETKLKYGYENSKELIYGTDQFIGETDYWNRGTGTELVQAVMEYLVGTLGAQRLVMDPMTWNERAIRCYEKCGYKKIRILPKNELHEGVYHDSWLVEYAPLTMPGDNRIREGIELREKGEYKESIIHFKTLIEDDPENAILQYQCAWSHDAMGQEAEAVPYYRKAIALGLKDEDLQGAYIGLGSTYRTLGEYKMSQEILKEGLEKFPNNEALKVFYSMTLYNLKEYEKAMDILLTSISKTSSDLSIQHYKRAIAFYSNQLDTIWKE